MSKQQPTNVRKMIQRLALLGGALFILGLVLTAIDWKRGSRLAQDIHIKIQPISGNHYIVDEDVLKIILDKTNQDLETIVIGRLNTRTIEDSLKADPHVLDAEVYVDAKDHIYIEIEQREPILRIKDNAGRDYYLDKEMGIAIPPSEHDVARVPVATGEIPNYRDRYWESSVNRLTSLYHVAKYIFEDDFLRPLIEQIHMEKDGDMTLVPKLGHHNIIFGSDDRLEEKFRHLKIFYKEALPYHGWEKYKALSLKYKGQVVGVK